MNPPVILNLTDHIRLAVTLIAARPVRHIIIVTVVYQLANLKSFAISNHLNYSKWSDKIDDLTLTSKDQVLSYVANVISNSISLFQIISLIFKHFRVLQHTVTQALGTTPRRNDRFGGP